MNPLKSLKTLKSQCASQHETKRLRHAIGHNEQNKTHKKAGKLLCSGRVSSFFSTSDSHRATHD